MAELGWRVGKLVREHGELVVTKSSRISCLPVAPEQARRRLVGSATLLEKLVVPGGYPGPGRTRRSLHRVVPHRRSGFGPATHPLGP